MAVALPPASAHLPGAAPLYQSGNATLAPAGYPNSTIHAYMDQIGLPPSVGDTLQIKFEVNNGTGVPIIFEIHTHQGVAGYRIYYNRTVANLDDSWKVPENASFMIYFENPYNFSVYLTYNFALYAPQPDMSPFIFLFPAVAGAALGWFLFVRAGRGLPPEGDAPPEEADEVDAPDEVPDDATKSPTASKERPPGP